MQKWNNEYWDGNEREEMIILSEKLEDIREIVNKVYPDPMELCNDLKRQINMVDFKTFPIAVPYAKIVTSLSFASHQEVIDHSSSPKELLNSLESTHDDEGYVIPKSDFNHSKLIISENKKRYGRSIPLQGEFVCNSQETNV